MFDITSLQLSDTTILHLVNPKTGEEMYADAEQTQPLEIEIYGRSSKQFRTWFAAQQRKAEAAKNKNKKKTPEEQQEDNADYYASITKSIRNIVLGDQALNNYDDFKKLYSNPKLYWVGDQVSEKVGALESFLEN